MDPLLISDGSRHRGGFTDLAFDLTQKSAGFRRSLPPSLLVSLASLVRVMNCYYSILIEGHDTHPVDIERALKNDYSKDPHKRDLQLEARAHINVQEWIDERRPKRPSCLQQRGNQRDSSSLLRIIAGRSSLGRRSGDQGTSPSCTWRTAKTRCPGRPSRRH